MGMLLPQPFLSIFLFPAATVYGKDADSWAADNIGSTNTQDQQYAVQLQNKEGYRTCELQFRWKQLGISQVALLVV